MTRTIIRPPASFIIGVDSNGQAIGGIWMSSRVCAYLETALHIDDFRRGGVPDPEVASVLEAMRGVASAWRGSVLGTRDALKPEPRREWISTGEAAQQLQLTPRAITKAIHEGRLRATSSDGRWRINREDLAHFMANR